MNEITKLKLLFWSTIIFILIFTINAILNNNYEFIYYSIILLIFVAITTLYHKKLRLSSSIISGLAILLFFHVIGGNILIGSTRLYDLYFIPGFFRYDNFVHLLGSFVAVFIIYNLLNPYLDKHVKHNHYILSILLILIALGIGALNEMAELLAVVFFNAANEVGDYLNNAIDIVFNFFGALIGCIFVMRHHKKKHKISKKVKNNKK